MSAVDIPAAVAEFWSERDRGVYFPPAWSGKLSLDDAYRIQLGLVGLREVVGGRQIGWKVGLTAKPIQEQFQVHEPVFGCLLEEGLKRSGVMFQHAALIKPGFENEICVRLGRDLPAADVDLAAARRAVDVCYPAFEIIETRGDLTKELPLALADNAQQKAFVLGEGRRFTADLDLAAVAVEVEVNGNFVAAGRGEAVLGNPLHSLVWLAQKLATFGRGLKAGELVMTGSFTAQFPIRPSSHIRARFEGLGTVEASFA